MANTKATKDSKSTTSSSQFDEELFETRLEALKDTQEGIQQMSAWCLAQRVHHKKIIQCWLNIFKKVRVEHRLVLFYLANDVIQYSKRKKYEYVECWATALQRATTMVRDERVKSKILRIFHIWEQREIYNEEFLSDLSGLLNISPPKKSNAVNDTSDDFQYSILETQIREIMEQSELTEKSFNKLPKMPNCDIDLIKQQLKDKSHSADIEKEIDRYVAFLNAFNKNLQNEIKVRKTLIESLDSANKFYTHQRGEVKVVATAYKNFGSRIKLVKKKLDDLQITLPSPIPSPDINAPSPERDADLQLPEEQSPISINNLFNSNINGYTSYLDGGKLPFDINDFKSEGANNAIKLTASQRIEVIGTRSSDDESYKPGADYYKSEPLSNSYAHNTNVTIPGLSNMPVQPEYNSLAQNNPHYNSALLPPPAPPHFSSGSNEYTPHGLNYNSGSEPYSPSAIQSTTQNMAPPPPLPQGLNSGTNTTSEDFNSAWDMNIPWTPLDNSSASSSNSYVQTTPHSPPRFERKVHNSTMTPIEYSEHHNDLMGTQDVDHRQIQLPPAFSFGAKLPLSKDNSRGLGDIDHRNLISLTGSPLGDKDFSSGDIDYRRPPMQQMPISNEKKDEAHKLMAPPSSTPIKKIISPHKISANVPSESLSDEARYDPTDMVIDMDMSDEDIDEILREGKESVSESATETIPTIDDSTMRPVLLETPDFMTTQQSQIWDTSNNNMLANDGYIPSSTDLDMQQQQAHPAWNQVTSMPWNGNGQALTSVPPPPRPPYQAPYPPFNAPPDGMRGRGRGRSWGTPYRNNYPRMRVGNNNNNVNFETAPPRPFYPRGGGPIRNQRGKFRGQNPWM